MRDILPDLDNWLSQNDLEPLVRPRAGGSLRAGFDGKSAASSASGQATSPRTFGHLGFTNMLAWADPERAISVAVLNNGKPIVYPELHRFLGTMQKITSEMPKAPKDERYF